MSINKQNKVLKKLMDPAIISAVVAGFFTIVVALIQIRATQKKSPPKNTNSNQNTEKFNSTTNAIDENINLKHFKLLYDSNDDSFESWMPYHTKGLFQNIIIEKYDVQKNPVLTINSNQQELSGSNKKINTLTGYVEFDYYVEKNNSFQDNIIFYVIPMDSNDPGQSGYIEAGSNKQCASRNQTNPFRVRKVLTKQEKHMGWKSTKIEFNFIDIPNAYYTIIAPRINEGSPSPSSGKFSIKNIRVFSNTQN